MSSARPPGRVVTFYSYKGGTGRSMALANVAFILAAAGKRVLVIDWDLEAPGLHRYFRPFLIDHELASSDGLIDLVDRYASEAVAPRPDGSPPPADWWHPLAEIDDHVLALDFPHFPSGGKIDLLPAGRQTESYGHKVSAFDWQTFYDRLGGGGFIDAVRERARAAYDWVLVDSRTGVSDTAGICTVQMPDAIVVCFTYNNQSIKGCAAVAAQARGKQAEVAQQRRRAAGGTMLADTPAPYRVFPVPMRVDAGESDRLALRQAYARETFAPLLDHLAGRDPADYWAAVEVPHRVFYAYEEVLAPFKDDARDPKTVLAAFVRLTQQITDGEVADFRLPIAPELRQRYLEAFAETPQTAAARQAREEHTRETDLQQLWRLADEALYALPEDQRALARSVLCRLVRLGREEDGGGVFPVRAALGEFDPEQHEVIRLLLARSLLTLATEARTQAQTQVIGREQVLALQDKLAAGWPTLHQWLAEDRDFILWRQRVRDARHDWERARDPGSLLQGVALSEARLQLRRRERDLNASERRFIQASIDAADATLPPLAASVPPAAAPPLRSPAAPARPAAADAAPARAAPRRWGWVLVPLVLVLAGLLGWGLVRSPAPRVPDVTVAAPASVPLPGLPAPATVDTAALVAEGDRLADAGQPDKAAEKYREAVNGGLGSDVPTLLKLARVLDRNGDFGGSAPLYARAVQLAPTQAQPLVDRAASAMAQRRFPDALADLDRARQLEPTNALVHFNRGVALENMNRADDAVRAYGEALNWQSDYVPALLGRARLRERSDPARAITDYQTVMRLPASEAESRSARERLQALGVAERKPPKALAAASARPRVFIQFADEADRARVEEVRRTMQALMKTAELPGIEHVSAGSASEVRYFFPADRTLAQQAAEAANVALAKTGRGSQPLAVTYRDAKAYPNAHQGTVELWLPSLSYVPPTRSLRPKY